MSDNASKNTIFGLGEGLENYVVQKSKPLLEINKSNLSLQEFKLLDLFLARIDSRNPDKNTVTLSKGEIEKTFGVDRIRYAELSKRLNNLGGVIEIPDKTHPEGFSKYWLFSTAKGYRDENGDWVVTMTASPDAMKLFFFDENIQYLRYKLKNVVKLRSLYSYQMFLYLEQNRFRRSWVENVRSLRERLKCTEDYYLEFAEFDRKVLKRCFNEINEKTDCKYEYEPDSSQKPIRRIRFTVQPLPKAIEEEIYPEHAAKIESPEPEKEQKTGLSEEERGEICGGMEDEVFAEFTKEQLEAMRDLAWTKTPKEEIERHREVLGSGRLAHEYGTSGWLMQLIRIAKTYGAKNMFSYVRGMVERAD